MEQRKKVVKGSFFKEQFDTLPKERQDEYLRRFKKAADSEDYIMSLPEEIRQIIILKMDPFDMYRLYNASIGPFKNYCDEVGWDFRIRNDFPSGTFVFGMTKKLNLVWTYFSLFFSELQNMDAVFTFVNNVQVDKWTMPCIRLNPISGDEEADPNFLIVLHTSNAEQYKELNDQVWEYFKNVTRYASFTVRYNDYEGESDRETFTLYLDLDRSLMFQTIYLLFELNFKLLDPKIPDKKYLVNSCISCNSAESAFICKSCKSATYCSKECQKKDWENGHFKACN